MQLVIFPFSELVFLLADEAAVAVELRLGVFVVNYLSIVRKYVVIFGIFCPNSTELRSLIVFWPIFNSYDFLYPANAELFFELEATLLVQLAEVELARVNFVIEELTSISLSEKLVIRSIQCFLNKFKFVFGLLFKQVFVDAPELELELQHLLVTQLLLV